ncbi:hypothetical protein F5Y05DRAFT_318806 [Hypoxylon sp. FL0543]|nr:hypothetical protein F5Y05DRAFT_318806 [Hypoxylon sp. FL0543]
MDLQGNLDKTYRVHLRWSNKPLRPRELQLWPTPEQNVERLRDAGETVERGLPKCTNCHELGHISKRCPQEKVERERTVIMCFNCDQLGHRVRDCRFSQHSLALWPANRDKAPNPARTCTRARTAVKVDTSLQTVPSLVAPRPTWSATSVVALVTSPRTVPREVEKAAVAVHASTAARKATAPRTVPTRRRFNAATAMNSATSRRNAPSLVTTAV